MEGRKAFDSGATAEHVPPERLPPPAHETRDVVVAAPQEETHPGQSNQLIRFLPIVTAVATVGVMAAAYHARSAVARNPVFMIFPLMMLVSAVATLLSGGDRRRGEINYRRAEYLGYLADVRASTVKSSAAQYYSTAWCHPDPDMLWTLVGGHRMWERRTADSDFCHVRIGVGTRPPAARLVAPHLESTKRLDPVSVTVLQRFLNAHETVANIPIAIALRDTPAVSIEGDPGRGRAVLRAMICQLAVTHCPTKLLIAAAVSDRDRTEWDWLKWLPHNRHPYARDDVGPVRMVYPSLPAVREALDDVRARSVGSMMPHILVVIDGERDDTAWTDSGATTVTIEPSRGEPTVVTVAGESIAARLDQLSYDAAVVCAQRMAGYRAGGTDTAPTATTWQELVGIPDRGGYSPPAHRGGSRFSVPVGTTETGMPVELDIKEAAANGMGPHGLCIGATGSGKSEFLRTVALGMIVGHSPEELNLVLVDFKGGATFSGLESAAHVAAVITNLSDKAALVARMREALMGEMNRRQVMLRQAGNLDGIAAYQRKRRAGAQLSPLPVLLIIVDEFSELLSQQPDFAEVFVAIGRLGRSLGVHLLLASQRLDEGRLRGLESHLSYRVCLKTLSVSESRLVLGTSQAYELPSTPGVAYLRVNADAPVRFQTALVSGRWAAGSVSEELADPQPEAPSTPVRLFTTEVSGPVVAGRGTEAVLGECPTVLETIVERLSGDGPRAHDVWLPPLGAAPQLSTVLNDAGPVSALTAPIGIVDRPYQQCRTPLVVDLSGGAGNVAVVGAPQSGKSTALRTLLTALAFTHDPRTVQVYCLDFGGGGLTALRDWPHVGSIAGRSDPERVRRTIARLADIVRSREALFREYDIDSIEHYRRLKAKRDPLCDRFGDVFLIVDGWPSLQREIESAESSITTLAAEGLSYGVHVVVTASRWAEIRPALRDQMGTRIELRLGDPADSQLDRRRAQQVPEGKPGRGLTHDGLQMIIALPQIDGDDLRSDLANPGWTAPPIPVLPARLAHDMVLEAAGPISTGLVVGVEENELQPLAIDFTRQPHLLVIGDAESGKTATLRVICRELLRTTTAAQCQLFVVDPRRSLLGVVAPESEQLSGYAGSAAAVPEVMPRLDELLRRRMPPDDVTPMQLRNRSWWSGPEIYVVIDDYDVLGAAGGNPLAPLAELLPHSRELGLHLVLARRCSGTARAMFEPLLAGLRDCGSMTLLMSGNPDDGLTIAAVRPSPLPPGRGVLITSRGAPQLIQVGWSPPL